MKYADLCKANVDFYNEHPTAHAAITVVYAVAVAVAVNALIKKVAKPQIVNIYYTP
jgi:hypothetical protein